MEAAESNGVGSEEWALAHEALSRLRLKRAALDADEGAWLLRAFRAATHVHFGHASFGEYIERLFGLSRRATEEKLRVAGALEELPELAEALRSGELNWSAVRELSRVAVSETEREWIAVARDRTAREVERMVSGLAPGDRPTDQRRPEFVRHILRFEVGAETLATFREAMKELRKRSDHRLDDDAALLLMAREVLGGPGDAGRASYQVVITQCEDCGRGFQHANGELIELDPAIVEMCHCDAQKVPVTHPRGAITDTPERRAGSAAQIAKPHADAVNPEDVVPAHAHPKYPGYFVQACAHAGDPHDIAQTHVARANSDEVAEQPVNAHPRNSEEVLEHRVAQSDDHRRNSEEVLEHRVAPADARVGGCDDLPQGGAHVGNDGTAHADVRVSGTGKLAEADVELMGAPSGRLKRQRATQDTPPAIRREVFWRDRGRCVVPGCRNAVYVDLHHLDLRSEGGSNEPDNLVVLCGAHHGALHRGRLRIDGRVSTGLRIRHADGADYGFMPSPLLAEASARAFAGLRRLGFSEKIARASIEHALAGAPANATAGTLLRSAVAQATCR